MGRTACGVRGVRLKNQGDRLIASEVISSEEESILIVCENGFGKRSLVEEFRQTKRGGSGVRSIITSERNGNVIGAVVVSDKDGVVMMSESGQTVRISMEDVRVMGRSTQGVKLVNLKDGDKLLGLVKLEAQEIEEEELAEAAEEAS